MKSTKNKLILIDADILWHSAAFSGEWQYTFDDQTVRHADADAVSDIFHVLIGNILQHTESGRFILCWSSPTNFRHDVCLDYKKNRKTARRPVVDRELMWTIKHRYPSIEVNHLEADDLMGLNSSEDTIIASDDKDLCTIPGLHFKPKKPEEGVFDITPTEAHNMWFKQILMGDATDGYKGIPGVGDKKSDKILENGGYTWPTIVEAYAAAGLYEEDALVTARLSRILHPGEWNYTTNKPKLWSPEKRS